uniref:Uncharacterized protein n=1 Tax=Helicotheca tamesis TaxID=374047 RepID=A0A7S2GRR0_9STRA|mmetsp:Transcript_11407/g.15806  ORF Transcript_11407/g.15806 Transcript_11407/m.15806 type:complete len:105 (+) Transcript_11407:9-323(+)
MRPLALTLHHLPEQTILSLSQQKINKMKVMHYAKDHNYKVDDDGDEINSPITLNADHSKVQRKASPHSKKLRKVAKFLGEAIQNTSSNPVNSFLSFGLINPCFK